MKSEEVVITLPSQAMVDACKRGAAIRKMTLSDYIVMCIKDHLAEMKAKQFSDMMDGCDFDD